MYFQTKISFFYLKEGFRSESVKTKQKQNEFYKLVIYLNYKKNLSNIYSIIFKLNKLLIINY